MATALSIIVPVFNGAVYIKDSLRSLIEQVVDGVEIIVVDDGSTDATVINIRNSFGQYLETGQLKLYTQKNMGVSAARNYGIREAGGRYVGFFDADDVAMVGYIQKIFEAMRSNADIVEFGFKTFVASVDELKVSVALYSNNQFGMHDIGEVIDKVFGISRWYPCTRVFRRALFDNVKFPIGVRFCEDLMTIPFLYEKAKTVFSLREALYGYRANPAGATVNVRPDYVHRLESFYDTIPRIGYRRHDYLRMAVVYAIYSCKARVGDYFPLSDVMRADMHKLRFSLSVYRDIDSRRVFLQLYPRMFSFTRRLALMFR